MAEIRQTEVANCVELRNCSYLALQRLSIMGEGPKGIPGLFGISAKGGPDNPVHHITIEDCVIADWNTSQQATGISTKAPVWDWTIRRNVIRDCGTGLYLGNSTGADPFVRGVIEHNLVQNPAGYCMEIKFQKTRPAIPGLPSSASRTLIRHNVFIKNDAPSPDGDRPNVLVGGFPDTGPGAEDLYEIYGNFFWHNPRESLLQVSGRVAIHDNAFASCPSGQHAAILVRDHDLPVKLVQIYHNTIAASARGIRFASDTPGSHAVAGNVVFAAEPLVLDRAVTGVSGNFTGPISAALEHLENPAPVLGKLDLRARPGHCDGAPLDLSAFATHTGFDRDFDGRPKGTALVRGAWSGSSGRPGWQLQASVKP